MLLLFVAGEEQNPEECIQFTSVTEIKAYLINLANESYERQLASIDHFLELNKEELKIGQVHVNMVVI